MNWRLSLAVLAVCGSVGAAEVQIVEQIVAKVNGDIITRGELDRNRRLLEQQLKEEKTPPEKVQQILKERENDALRDQIDGLLLVSKAKEIGINADAEVTRQLAEIQKQQKI